MTEETDSKAGRSLTHKGGFKSFHIKYIHPSTHNYQSSDLLVCINNGKNKSNLRWQKQGMKTL